MTLSLIPHTTSRMSLGLYRAYRPLLIKNSVPTLLPSRILNRSYCNHTVANSKTIPQSQYIYVKMDIPEEIKNLNDKIQSLDIELKNNNKLNSAINEEFKSDIKELIKQINRNNDKFEASIKELNEKFSRDLKEDIKDVKKDLKDVDKDLKKEFKEDVKDLKEDLKEDVKDVKKDLKENIKDVDVLNYKLVVVITVVVFLAADFFKR